MILIKGLSKSYESNQTYMQKLKSLKDVKIKIHY